MMDFCTKIVQSLIFSPFSLLSLPLLPPPPPPPLLSHPLPHTPYRMSVKRTSKQEKEEMAKHAVKYEAMMRRQSLAQQASLPYNRLWYSLVPRPERRRRKGLVSTFGRGNEANYCTTYSSHYPPPPPPQDAERDISHSQDKMVMKEVCNEILLDEDEGTAVLLLSVTKTDTSTNDTSTNDSSKNNLENSVTKKLERPEALEIDESAFKRPQKSVLKKTPASPAVSYTSSSSFFPADDVDRKGSNERDCCTVM